MRLTLDITPTLLRSAGVRNHLYYWTRALEADLHGNRLEFYPFLKELPDLNHDRGIESGIPNWRLFLVFAMNNGLASGLVPRAEVFHGSPQLRRRPRTRRLTAHIHDLTCWLMPEFHTEANVQAAHEAAEHVWRQADGLIAVSQSARDDAVRLLGLNPDRMEVIPHGVPEEYFTVRDSVRPGKPYVLTVGTIEPRKNIDLLLDAWAALPGDVRDAFDLVIAGPAGWKSEGTLARLRADPPFRSGSESGIGGGSGVDDRLVLSPTEREGRRGAVRYLGYVPESDLPALTAGATVHVYPSLYEGFGFPLAQAMAAGVASVTSNVSSLPEVSAGSALLVDPRSQTELRDALLRLLTAPALRQELGERGHAYAAAHYRWPLIARWSWEFFERVAAS
jgi:alpha-1,3-rhamnosyl/mannosyltransferase